MLLAMLQGRLEGVLAYRMGQRNTLGAYPFHWHNIGWVSNSSYARDCSVYHAFYRCEQNRNASALSCRTLTWLGSKPTETQHFVPFLQASLSMAPTTCCCRTTSPSMRMVGAGAAAAEPSLTNSH